MAVRALCGVGCSSTVESEAARSRLKSSLAAGEAGLRRLETDAATELMAEGIAPSEREDIALTVRNLPTRTCVFAPRTAAAPVLSLPHRFAIHGGCS